ncbi:TonB-dependent receptor, partial [Lysobacter sp. 2RAB21]
YITKFSNCDVAKLQACLNDPNARPITQTMDLGEVGYKFSNESFDLFATLFYTKYDNVGFSNYVFNLGNGASTVQQGFADTKTTGLELEGYWTPTRW